MFWDNDEFTLISRTVVVIDCTAITDNAMEIIII
jgi:hypothetical protein